MPKSTDLELVPLYKHQEGAIDKMRQGGYALHHEQGLGKTRSALVAFRHLTQTDQADTMIVICPKIAKHVWAKEAELCGMNPARTVVLKGTKPSPEMEMYAGDIVILNYDILKAWLSTLIELPLGRTVIVFDEAHNLRNNRTSRYKTVVQLIPFANRVWELTGTPMVNSAMDIYWQLRLLGPSFPYYYMKSKTFGNKFCNTRFNGFTGDFDFYGIKNEAVLSEKCRGVVDRKLKADCLDLPAKLRVPVWLERQADMGVNFGTNALDSLGRARHNLSPRKGKLTIDYLEQALEERPVIVIGYHHTYMNMVGKHFNAPIIDGDTSENLRIKYMGDFEAGGIPILIGQLQAMGTAITLVRGCHLVFGELHWSAVDHRQAEDRLHRPGQTRDVTYHYLMIENSVDDLVWRHVLRKGQAIDRLDQAATGLSAIQPLFTSGR